MDMSGCRFEGNHGGHFEHFSGTWMRERLGDDEDLN